MTIERIRGRLAVLLVLAIAVATIALGMNNGYPVRRALLDSAAAWLRSEQIGQMTLLDGAAREVITGVPVSPPGVAIRAAGDSRAMYIEDRSTGSVVRLDTAAQVTNRSARLSTTGSPLSLAPAPGIVWVIDAAHGQVMGLDPTSLGPILSRRIPGPLSQWATDDSNRLWLISQMRGEVVRLSQDGRAAAVRTSLGRGVVLTVADGAPVVVDPGAGIVRFLHPEDGRTRVEFPLPVTTDDLVTANPIAGRAAVQVVVNGPHPRTMTCASSQKRCTAPVDLTGSAGPFGAAVSVGRHVMIPDQTEGRAWIVDPSTGTARISKPLFSGSVPQSFDLEPKLDFALFNDPTSAQAGTVDLLGEVHRIVKYKRPTAQAQPTSSPAATPTPQPSRTPTGSPPPSTGTSASRPGDPGENGAPEPERTGRPEPAPGTTAPVLQIVPLNGLSAYSGQSLGFRVRVSDRSSPVRPTWTFGDDASGTGISVSHSYAGTGTYAVSVSASHPTTGKQLAPVSVTVSINDAPNARCGDALTQDLTLNFDMHCDTSPAFLFDANEITLDLGGHTLTGSGSGIAVQQSRYNGGTHGNTIRNGRIRGFDSARCITGGDWDFRGGPASNYDLTLENLDLKDCSFFVWTADVVNVHMDGGLISIYYHGRNNFYGSTLEGVVIDNDDSADGSTFRGNIIRNSTIRQRSPLPSPQDHRFILEDNDFYNTRIESWLDTTIRANRFEGSGSGVIMHGYGDVTRNVFRDTTVAVEVPSLKLGTLAIKGNDIRGSRRAGIWVHGSRTKTLEITDNSLSDNGHDSNLHDEEGWTVNDGIHTSVALPEWDPEDQLDHDDALIRITDNHASGNADYGIEARTGIVKDGGGNTSDDPSGCIPIECG